MTDEEIQKELDAYYKETDELFEEFFRRRQLEILDALVDGQPRPKGIRDIMDARARRQSRNNEGL
jgi:hypothetical protein